MKKIPLISLTLLSSLLLTSCTNTSGSTSLTQDYPVTQEEKQQIETVAGKTEEEQDEYVEKMSETVSANSHIEILEQELNDTVILEEDFSDLE